MGGGVAAERRQPPSQALGTRTEQRWHDMQATRGLGLWVRLSTTGNPAAEHLEGRGCGAPPAALVQSTGMAAIALCPHALGTPPWPLDPHN